MHPEQIKAELRMKGYTLSSLADELGKSRAMVTHVVQGAAKSAVIQDRIAAILGKPKGLIWQPAPSLRRGHLIRRATA